MEEFCNQHLKELALDDWSTLLPSSLLFLKKLDLPALHPYCNASSQSILLPSAPDMGPPTEPININLYEHLITGWYYYVPPTIALFEVWFFFLAGYLAPAGALTLLWLSTRQNSLLDFHPCIGATTLISSWILMTDDQYVMEFGRPYGMILLLVTLFTLRPNQRHYPLLLVVCVLCASMSPWSPEDPDNMSVTVKPGLYYNADNSVVNGIIDIWKKNLPDYAQVATPWQWTGDARTGMPYTLNHVDRVPIFHRVWLPTVDNEFVALDVAFPSDGGHNWQNPLYLVFHGLNGGSKEGYVIDFCRERTKEGSTCVVMIARGLSNTPLQGWTFFHGVRTDDAHSAASILRDRVKQPDQVIAGVGYSLGAIVLNHYVSSYGDQVALDISVSISGALDCNYQQLYIRSQRIWQSMIVAHMKDQYLFTKWGDRIYRQLGQRSYQQLMRAKHIVDADAYTGVLYNGYEDLQDFYSQMSSVLVANGTKQSGYFSIPHLILQSFDDPISSWRTNAANEPSSPLYPRNLVNREESSNLVVLLTETGGHVGWPMGWFPHSWNYMNNLVAAGFVSAYVASQDKRTESRSGENEQEEFMEHTDVSVGSDQECATLTLEAQEFLTLASLEKGYLNLKIYNA